jgi:FixJ family two-component response regulator
MHDLATDDDSVVAGAADFIVKPFSREASFAKIDRYLPAVG